jgi:hypothetical protein
VRTCSHRPRRAGHHHRGAAAASRAGIGTQSASAVRHAELDPGHRSAVAVSVAMAPGRRGPQLRQLAARRSARCRRCRRPPAAARPGREVAPRGRLAAGGRDAVAGTTDRALLPPAGLGQQDPGLARPRGINPRWLSAAPAKQPCLDSSFHGAATRRPRPVATQGRRRDRDRAGAAQRFGQPVAISC